MTTTVIGNATLHLGDCLDVLKTLPADSVDAIVTDPPAGIGFMGKDWDHHKGGRKQWIAWMTEIARECLRVLKPGGHALVWAIPRTSHWTATAWEKAGFEIRDRIAHVFGSGFPKSADVSKMIDKLHGAEREAQGWYTRPDGQPRNVENWQPVANADRNTYSPADQIACKRVTAPAPATDQAKQWHGWGTALKPAMEDWWLCRKPLDGTVAANVLKHGVGGINVDACRVGTDFIETRLASRQYGNGQAFGCGGVGTSIKSDVVHTGRFPANLIHDGSDEVVALFPQTTSGFLPAGTIRNCENHVYGLGMASAGKPACLRDFGGDTGSAARFFYCAKADKSDRDEGCHDLPEVLSMRYGEKAQGPLPQQTPSKPVAQRNHHPTVKPTDLMRYLCRLITPPGGILLDPFMGSGSTGKAAMLEGFRFIGIEREPDYLAIAQARIKAAQRQPDLFHPEAVA